MVASEPMPNSRTGQPVNDILVEGSGAASSSATEARMPLSAGRTLRQRVLHAGSWSLGGHAVSQIIRLGSNLILTRLLLPEAFGMLAIVIVLMVGFALFSDLGIGQNIVRSPRGDEPIFLDTAWSVQILRGAVIWAMALLAAAALPLAAGLGWVKAGTVYADPALPRVIAVYSLTLLISGFASTKVATARRHMKLRPIIKLELVSQVLALVVIVPIAWWTHSIWALVAGSLVACIASTVLGHVVLPGHPNRLAWDPSAVQDLVGFGKWVFLSSILGFLVLNGDRLLLSGMVDAQTMGLYAIAFLLINAVQNVMTMATGNIVFPALSEVVRDRPHDLAATSNKFQRLGDLYLMTVCGFLIPTASLIVDLLYDARYQAAGPMLMLLAIGTIGWRYQIIDQCYVALGKPQLVTAINLMRLLVLYVGLPIGFHYYQFVGALVAIVASQFASWPASIYFKLKYRLMDWRVEMLALAPFALGLMLGFGFQYAVTARSGWRLFPA